MSGLRDPANRPQQRGLRLGRRNTAEAKQRAKARQIWSKHYDRDLAQTFELQDEITLTIAGTIEPELLAKRPDFSMDLFRSVYAVGTSAGNQASEGTAASTRHFFEGMNLAGLPRR